LVFGAVIAMNSQCSTPMQAGPVYAFAKGQFIQQPATVSSYVIANATSTGSYAFGLAQTATINNVAATSPLSAKPVLYNEAIYLNPTDLIAIFLSSATKGGTVIPPPTNAFSINVSSASAEVTIGFNDQTNTFYQIA
jgi:PKD repeat protein